MAKRSFYINESEFDDYQLQVVRRRIDNSFLVKGNAGSGKSILALWKVKQIQEENKGSFYFIVFTKTLKQYMEDGIKEIGLNNSKVVYYWEWENKLGAPITDYIVVDEAQDFSEKDINLFRSKSKKALIMYGDTAQQLYAFRKDNLPISMEEIAVLTSFSIEQLVFNYRLPKKIARLAEHLESTGDELVEKCKNEGSELPKILEYTMNKQLDAIIDIINTRRYDDTGIFFQKNADVEYAYNYFNKKGLKVEAKFNKFIDLDFNSSLPKLVTYHSCKGLQFEAALLPNCEDIQDKNINALYVAITRTYQDLFIMHSGNLTNFFDDVPESLYETSLVTEDIDW